ncbi:MAG: ABC transporter substrate-binding protein [Alphaproteobacteria bacterium]|nr:ABC transporter substrate-binding protein [Alphaproteobacteria bacterium]
MRRRTVVIATSLLPLSARAQGRRPVVCVMRSLPSEDDRFFRTIFERSLAQMGWTNGANVDLEFVEVARRDQLAERLATVTARRVDAIVVFGGPAVRAALAATTEIPVVGMSNFDRGAGASPALVRPGTNLTGISILTVELDAKRLELLHEAVPAARRVAVLMDSDLPMTLSEVAAMAARLDIELLVHRVNAAAAIDAAVGAAIADRPDGVSVLASSLLNSHRDRVIGRLNEAGLPAIYEWPEAAGAGALLGYGARLSLVYGRLAALVGKILRGAQPSALPIEQPLTVELAVNLRTARAIGLQVPSAVLARADEVIE